MTSIVRPAVRADLKAASAIFASAFGATPQWRWLIAADDVRARVLPGFFRASLGHALSKGRLTVSVDESSAALDGVAAWMPPGQWRVPSWRGLVALPTVMPLIPGGHLKEFSRRGPLLDRAAHDAHPAVPHWYLAGVAVLPSGQARGVGSRLVEEGVEHASAGGHPLYLECAEDLVGYYERFGFGELNRIEAGEGAPVQIGMWHDA
ncbi:GNAT family N-acetyltransferase [Aestuariimicrobium ganziense]|uniref:GNAT family N-acetyltransferase n=1 Tax=Aestuariimicrobium ganziense TaxID=2773677 RepID=UPI001944EC08|nr:GNAT family N-acetyltransferase [Aestuariimicrobium ganziense]